MWLSKILHVSIKVCKGQDFLMCIPCSETCCTAQRTRTAGSAMALVAIVRNIHHKDLT